MSLPPQEPGGRSFAGLAERIALALLLGAAAADLLGAAMDAPMLWEAGARLALAGIAAGGLALLAGLRREGRRWRRTAALLAALGLFALAAWVRGSAAIPPDPGVLLVEAIAAALLLVAAWLKPLAQPERAP